MALSVDQFGKAMVSAGLFTADELKALWNAIPADARPKQGDGFAKLLVQQGKLNQFQADELLSGRNTPLVMGDYLLVAELGAGGMGKVYKARHRRMERIVALKVMSTAAMQDEAAVKRFQREVKAAARLEHPNIVTAYDSGESGKVKYLVMQFVDGGDLSDLVKKNGALEVERAVDYVLQAARGLGFAHGEGVVHRDIKPANLLLDKKGLVKILDMGLARIEGGDGLTATEQVMGTVDYMSPEQAANTKTADGRSDIYSLGCTLWFLLTAKKVYDGDTMISRLMSHRNDPPPSLVKARDDVPWSLEQAFHKMIAKSPEDRFQSMDEVVAALEPFAPSGGSRSGAGSSIGMGPQSAEMASFLKSIGPAVKPQTKPAPTGTKVDVEATAQFAAAGADTDPKSEILRPPKKATQPQAKGSGKKPPPNKNLLLAAAGGGALLVLLGVWFIFRDKEGNETARVQMPDGGSVAVQQTATTAGKTPVATATRPPISFFLPNSTPASPSGTTTPPSVAPPPAVPSSNGVVYLDDLHEKSRFAFGGGGFKKPGRDPNAADDLKKSFPGASPVHALVFDANLTTSVERENAAPSITSHNVAARVVYDLAGKYASFQSGLRAKRNPDFIAEVWGDGKRLWESGAFVPNDAVGTSAEVDVRGVQELTLFFWSDSDSQHAAKLLLIEPRLTLVTLPSEPPTSVSRPSIAPPPAVPSANGVVYLDDLQELEAEVGYMTLGKHGTTKGRTALSWRGSPVAHSLWMRPKVNHVSFVRYRLDGQYARFEADAGQIPETNAAPASPMTFRVLGDGRELWKSKPIAAKDDFDTVSVDVRGVQELRLETTCGSKEHLCEATWYNPRLTPISAPQSVAPPRWPFDPLDGREYVWSEPENLGSAVNTPQRELNPSLTSDELTLFFCRDATLFVARRADRQAPFAKSEPFANSDIGLPDWRDTNSVSITGDGLTMYVQFANNAERGIWISQRTSPSTRFGKPVLLPAPVNTAQANGKPIVSADGRTLCLTSTRPSKLQSSDVYLFRRNSPSDPFGGEQNLGRNVNTRGMIVPDWISNDGRVLVSTVMATMPFPTYWHQRNSQADQFSPGMPLGPPFTEEKMLGSTWVSPDGQRIYFHSRSFPGGHRELDIWFSRRVPKSGSAQQPMMEPTVPTPELAVAPFDAAQAKAHQAAWAKHLGAQVETVNRVGQKMILIPPGEFLMGSTDEQIEALRKIAEELKIDAVEMTRVQQRERPQHRVVITKPFQLSATEVTVGQFKKFVAATGYRTEAETIAPKQINLNTATDDLPTAGITWNDAEAYCKWLSEQEKATYRLPTEAEWEFACRAGTATQYSFGDDAALLDQYEWNYKNSRSQLQSAGTKLPNAFGLFDMHGSLHEWCRDYFAANWYGASPPNDPTGPQTGSEHVTRGGNYWPYSNALQCRSAYRASSPAANKYSFLIGFRCAQELDVPAVAASTTSTKPPSPGVVSPVPKPTPTGTQPPAATGVSPAAPRWPLEPSKPEDIVWLHGLKATLTLRAPNAIGGGPTDVRVQPGGLLPTGAATIVGIDFGRDNFAQMTDDVLKRTATLVDLESLSLGFGSVPPAVTKDGLPLLATLVHLRQLNLTRIGRRDTDPAFLERFVNLESLSLGSQTFLDWEPHVARLPALAELRLDKMGAANLQKLGPMPRLKELGLGDYGAAEGSKRHEAAKQYAPLVPWCRITVFGQNGPDPRVVIEPTAPPPAATSGTK